MTTGDAPLQQQRILLVSGMHRSGTSMLSKVMNTLGFAPSRDLMEGDRHNANGYFEPKRLVALNDRLFSVLGRHWAEPKPLEAGWQDRAQLAPLYAQAQALFDEEYAGRGPLVLKDPRFCLLLPFWQKLFAQNNVALSYLFSFRNPLDVAKSLKTRDFMRLEHAAELWLSHTLAAVEAAPRDAGWVPYGEMMVDWRSGLGAGLAAAKVSLTQELDGFSSEMDGVISADLYHHQSTLAEVLAHPDLPEAVKTSYQLLCQTGQPVAADFAPLIAAWRQKWASQGDMARGSGMVEDLPAWNMAKAQALRAKDAHPEAATYMRRAISLAPEQASGYFQLANILREMKESEAALEALEAALARDPMNAIFLSAVARAYAQSARKPEAIAACEKGIAAAECEPKHATATKANIAELFHQKGNYLMDIGDLEAARDAQIAAVAHMGSRASYHLSLSRAHNRLNEGPQAVLAAGKAVEFGADLAGNHHHLACLLREQGRHEEAFAHFGKATELNNAAPEFQLSLCHAARRMGQGDVALKSAKRAAELAPDVAPTQFLVGTVLREAGRPQDALPHFQRAATLAPKQPNAFVAARDVLAALGQKQDACDVLVAAVESMPNNVALKWQLGAELTRLGAFDAAIVHLDRAAAMVFGQIGFDPRLHAPDPAVLDALAPTQRDNLTRALAWSGAQNLCETARSAISASDAAIWPLGARAVPDLAPNIAHMGQSIAPPAPVLSIMIPVYNLTEEAWLVACLDSVLAQGKGADWAEIVVIDDASTTPLAEEIVARYGPRVRYERNPENLGILGNHNQCITRAAGQFVHILHQDDMLGAGFYDAVLTPLEQDNTLMASYCQAAIVDVDGAELRLDPLEQDFAGICPSFAARIGAKQRVFFPSMIVRRTAYEAVGGFTAALIFAFDWEMWARVAAAGSVYYTPRPLVRYRVHGGSTTNSLTGDARFVDCLRTVARIAENLPEPVRKPYLLGALYLVCVDFWSVANQAAKTGAGDAIDARARAKLEARLLACADPAGQPATQSALRNLLGLDQ